MTQTEKQLYLNLITAQDTYPPRDYQIEAVQKVFAAFAQHRRVLLQMPTGTGKTPTFCYIARKFLERGERVMVVAHRQELIDQAYTKIEAIAGIPAGFIKAGKPVNPERDIQVASVQTLVRRKGFPNIGLLIIDEAHHACSKTYQKIFDAYPNAYILGVTATPNRSDGQSLKKQFDEIVVSSTVAWFIEKGYLSPYKAFAAPNRVDTTGIRITNGDYNLGDLAEKTSAIIGDVLTTWSKMAANKQTVVFAVNVDHSKRICQSFINDGIIAAHLDGDIPEKLRQSIIDDFGKGKIKVLTNCGIVTEGFDCPGIECVQIARPTASLVLWLQMLGRGLRPDKGKDHAIIIDHTNNTTTLGLPDDNFEWSLEPTSLEGIRSNQQCPQCRHIFRPLAHEMKPQREIIDAIGTIVELAKCTCPKCGTDSEFQLSRKGGGDKPREIETIGGELTELDLTLHHWAQRFIDDLVFNQQSTSKAKAWVKYRLEEHPRIMELSLGDWRYAALKLGYKMMWAWYQYNECQYGRVHRINISETRT